LASVSYIKIIHEANKVPITVNINGTYYHSIKWSEFLFENLHANGISVLCAEKMC
jgi:hypothetical protein